MIKRIFFIVALGFLSLPFSGQAQSVLGQNLNFNIESSYDLNQRTEITAVLIKLSPTAYWYADNAWWSSLNSEQQGEVEGSLISLTTEFEEKIHPVLTRTFGSEWTPGIDKDTRITILFHPMKKGTGGYTDTADEYPKVQIPESNEREMIYLNAQYINTAYIESFLAHEFVHLITFNQKNKPYNVLEDTWLNEARAEYAATLLGYDENYEGSNLQRRVKDFLDKPSDSLTEWRDLPADYGVANLFIQYLVDHYGGEILSESLKLKQTGIKSINAVLLQRGFKENFAQIFNNWTIAILLNDCKISDKYCYFNQNLKDFRITPLINYLPFIGKSTLSVNNATKDWAGNWHKFIGGQGSFNLEFRRGDGMNFQVPYIVQNKAGEYSVGSLDFNSSQSAEIFISDFGSENISVIIIPIAQNKEDNFSGLQPTRTFSWSASTEEKEEIIIPSLSPLPKPIFQMTRVEILARIAEIQQVIVGLQKLIIEMGVEFSCQGITQNLAFGISDNAQVKCLQEFLKSQGSLIYPEGIVNGNFFSLTQQAVIRFQEKYASEILAPVGLIKGTGFVGQSTRAKINEMLSR
ncbi:MAG: hypothetical protein Q8P63_02285 [Candidatus Nealsonbacteria bacterium]|nr:hypothetical protein [Candidatus Nealsonbacteria bacterium]